MDLQSDGRARKPFAGFGLGMYEQLSSPGDWAAAIAFGGFLEVLFWIGPLGLLPLFTVGESRRAISAVRQADVLEHDVCDSVRLGFATIDRGWSSGSAMGFSDYWPALLLLPWLIWWFSVLVRLGGGSRFRPSWSRVRHNAIVVVTD